MWLHNLFNIYSLKSYITTLHYIYLSHSSITIATALDIFRQGTNDLDPLCHLTLGSLCCFTMRLLVLLGCKIIISSLWTITCKCFWARSFQWIKLDDWTFIRPTLVQMLAIRTKPSLPAIHCKMPIDPWTFVMNLYNVCDFYFLAFVSLWLVKFLREVGYSCLHRTWKCFNSRAHFLALLWIVLSGFP